VKVTIVGGGGGIGSSVAFNLLIGPSAFDVVLVDRRARMVTSHVMDLEQALEQGATGHVRAGDHDDVVDADVVVLCAGAPMTVNPSRMVYLHDNAAIVRATVDRLPASWSGLLVVVTNPVDPLCTWLAWRTGLPRARLLGYTLNDTLRLRTAIAKVLGAEPGTVSAWAVGEHGDHAVVLWDRVTVTGEHVDLALEQRAAAEDFLRGWYLRHVELDAGRSSTWTTGLGVARMLAAVDRDRGELVCASVMLDGEYGIEDVCLSVPVRIGRAGAQRIEDWRLNDQQLAAMRKGAAVVRRAARSLPASARRARAQRP
jgi:malate/lactate dehydrogenase